MNRTSGLKVSEGVVPLSLVTFKTEIPSPAAVFAPAVCHSAATLLTSYAAHEDLCVNRSSCPNPRAPSSLCSGGLVFRMFRLVRSTAGRVSRPAECDHFINVFTTSKYKRVVWGRKALTIVLVSPSS